MRNPCVCSKLSNKTKSNSCCRTNRMIFKKGTPLKVYTGAKSIKKCKPKPKPNCIDFVDYDPSDSCIRIVGSAKCKTLPSPPFQALPPVRIIKCVEESTCCEKGLCCSRKKICGKQDCCFETGCCCIEVRNEFNKKKQLNVYTGRSSYTATPTLFRSTNTTNTTKVRRTRTIKKIKKTTQSHHSIPCKSCI